MLGARCRVLRQELRRTLRPLPLAPLAAGAIVCAWPVAAHPAFVPLSGVWEAVQVNRQPLPMTDAVVGDDGLTHTVRLHSMVIRLNSNGRFQAVLKYRRAILARAQRIDAQPLLNDTWIGTYTQTGTQMKFVPEKRGQQRVTPFSGVAKGQRITVTFDYENVTRKHYVLDLDRNADIH